MILFVCVVVLEWDESCIARWSTRANARFGPTPALGLAGFLTAVEKKLSSGRKKITF